MRYLSLFIVLIFLTACEDRKWQQVISDTRSAALATEQTADPEAQLKLYRAVCQSVISLTDKIKDLPKPTQTPVEIIKDPEVFVAATEKTISKTLNYDPPAPPAPSGISILKEELILGGKWGLRVGGGLFGLSILVLGILYFTAPLWVASHFLLFEEGMVAGAGLALIGTSALWLNDHLWLLALVIVLSLGFIAIRYRAWYIPICNRLLGFRKQKDQ